MREVLFIALVLACPLLMLLMMRGGHGGNRARHDDGRHGGDERFEPLARERPEHALEPSGRGRR